MKKSLVVWCGVWALSCSLVCADVPYFTTASLYSQNFDSLLATGTGNTWTNNATIAGWYSNRITYNAGTGSSNTGALYSFGDAGSAERALGSVASGSTGTIHYGVGFVNLTGGTLSSFTVRYDGEQWRDGGNTTQHSLAFDYKIGSGLLITDTGYTLVPQLDFLGPVATSTAGALSGNSAANRVAGITYTVTGINWMPGQQLYLRWTDIDNAGADHGLAIDNFEFFAVPEPSVFILLGGLALVAGCRRGAR